MTLRSRCLTQAGFGYFVLLAALFCRPVACTSQTSGGAVGGTFASTGGATGGLSAGATGAGATGGANAGGTTAGSASGGSSGAGTGGADVACTPEVPGGKTHAVGNYDNVSCNKADCHFGEVGGWVYASPQGYPWIAGATVTITDANGTVLTAISGEDGFFDFGPEPAIVSPYKVCVSKCPSTDCNLTTHTSVDCLSSNCHSLKTQRIYVTTPGAGTGGSGPIPGESCAQPAPGGPYVHTERGYSTTQNRPCIGCHAIETPNYKGGFLYDGPEGTATVAEATVTLKPDDGSPALTATTGPDGMFFFGDYGQTTSAAEIPAGYVACVSKCPTSEICSPAGTHPTNDDCGTCHDNATTGRVYLR